MSTCVPIPKFVTSLCFCLALVGSTSIPAMCLTFVFFKITWQLFYYYKRRKNLLFFFQRKRQVFVFFKREREIFWFSNNSEYPVFSVQLRFDKMSPVVRFLSVRWSSPCGLWFVPWFWFAYVNDANLFCMHLCWLLIQISFKTSFWRKSIFRITAVWTVLAHGWSLSYQCKLLRFMLTL